MTKCAVQRPEDSESSFCAFLCLAISYLKLGKEHFCLPSPHPKTFVKCQEFHFPTALLPSSFLKELGLKADCCMYLLCFFSCLFSLLCRDKCWFFSMNLPYSFNAFLYCLSICLSYSVMAQKVPYPWDIIRAQSSTEIRHHLMFLSKALLQHWYVTKLNEKTLRFSLFLMLPGAAAFRFFDGRSFNAQL